MAELPCEQGHTTDTHAHTHDDVTDVLLKGRKGAGGGCDVTGENCERKVTIRKQKKVDKENR